MPNTMPPPRYNKKKRISDLRDLIYRHDLLYYKQARPEITDFEYDLLKKELQDLENTLPPPQRESSPTNLIGDDRLPEFSSYTHKKPMFSIDNSYDKEELFEFDKRLQRLLEKPSFDYVIEPKIDGVAVSLTYENGTFIRAVTRGNGTTGDDITANAKTIKDLPPHLLGSNFPDLIEIRGEIYIRQNEFERINRLREEDDLPPYANPRNLAAGTVKLLDPKETRQRKLSIVLYGIGYCHPPLFKTQNDVHKTFKTWGLPTQEKYWSVHGIQAAWNCIEELHKIKENFAYGTDGAVIKLNDIRLQETAGSTAKAPRAIIAYKFAPEQATTLLKNITIQVGRTGVLTPVAELEPINLAGSTVSRATLHNEDEINRKEIRIGAKVIVEKAGEVIPAVVQPVKDNLWHSAPPYKFPTKCPACGTQAIRLPGEVAWKCPNASCPPQVRRRITHFASKAAMDIENLGKAVVDQLVTQKLCHHIADLYSITEEQLIPLEKFAEKSAKNLIQSIQESKTQPLWRLIHGLGIENVGQQGSKDLAQHFKSLDALIAASFEELLNIEGVGPIVAESILSFFQESHNQKIIKSLIQYGLNTRIETNSSQSQTLTGKTFVITGTLPTLSRDDAKELIENAGGRVSSSVSKNTNFLLAGESPGSKYNKSKELNIPIIAEEDLKKLLNI